MESVATAGGTIFSFLGLNTPTSRFIGVTGLGTAAEFYRRPRYAFTETGEVRPWAVMNSDPGSSYTPVAFFPVIAGLLAALYF